jgi:uncharacterized protein (TIGR02646 family)
MLRRQGTMIRIKKSTVAPIILTGDGAKSTRDLNVAYRKKPAIYTSAPGVSNRTLTSMTFDSGIYGDQTVKQKLISDQFGKCCFCESIFLETSYGDVEHFRPKTAYKKRGARGLTYPGYYWLAYDWTNLMLSCEKCNRSYKKNDFPLEDESTRKPFHNHANRLTKEHRLLVNPNAENPAIYLTFKEEIPVPVNKSLKGKTTIETFGLERMNGTRLDYLGLLKNALVFTKVDPNNEAQMQSAMATFGFTKDEVLEYITRANHLHNTAAKNDAKFSHCVRCKFPELPTV